MVFHLVSGGCGFVGRNMVRRLYQKTADKVLFIDNLIAGRYPQEWISLPLVETIGKLEVYGLEKRLLFLKMDFREFIKQMLANPNFLHQTYQLPFQQFHDIYHFAAHVGGRITIEQDPISIAQDLSIDADFFNWISKHPPQRVLYPSSSAAYPISLQREDNDLPLSEDEIDFSLLREPDLVYGWAKLTGEYLAKWTAQHYGISIACVRPFSGYGEDQDLNYPIPAIVHRFVNKEDPIIVWGNGEQSRDFVYIQDLLDAMELAIANISDGSATNICTGKATSFLEILSILSKIADYQPSIQTQLEKPVGVFKRYGNPDIAKKKLGWKAKISLDEGLRKVYDFVADTNF